MFEHLDRSLTIISTIFYLSPLWVSIKCRSTRVILHTLSHFFAKQNNFLRPLFRAAQSLSTSFAPETLLKVLAWRLII